MAETEKPYMDIINNVASEVRRYSGEVAGFVDGNFDRMADLLRDRLAEATWIPEPIRNNLPKPRAPPVVLVDPSVHLNLYERTQAWILRHRILTTLLALAFGTVAYRSIRRLQSVRKFRRARRARNGARCEVVVIAASPALPITQSLALDLERRGYILYIVCGSAEDEHFVRQMARPDIRPLSIDITDSAGASAALERFALYLHAPHAAVPGARKNHLSLTAVILIPSLNYQTSPIATIPPSSFADLFNTHLLHPILSIQAFLPLLTARTALQPGEKKSSPSSLLSAASLALVSSGVGNAGSSTQNKDSASEKDAAPANGAAPVGAGAAAAAAAAPSAGGASSAAGSSKPDRVSSPPKVLVFTPSIISSVNPPFHAPESTVCSALTAFTEVLAAELRPLAIPVTHIQLGTFDFSGFAPARSATAQHFAFATTNRMPPPAAIETLAWSEPARHVYGRNFTAQSTSALGSGRAVRGMRGTATRDLHHAVFDVLDGSSTASVVRIGLGADLYGFVGSFVPRGLVAWMMGVRRVDNLDALYKPPPVAAAPASTVGSSMPNPNASVVSNSSDRSEISLTPARRGKKQQLHASGFVNVDETVADSHIWR